MLSKLVLAVLLLVSIFTISSFAVSVSVTRTTYQDDKGTLIYVYFVISSTLGSTTPSANTATSPSSSSGSYSIAKSASAYVWSPQFSSSTAINAGTWVVDFWIAGSKSGSPVVWIYITNAAGVVQSTLVNGVSGSSISANVETQVVMTFSLGSANIPASGYMEVQIQPPSASTGTLYWGVKQQTNFQVPYRMLSS